MPVQFSTIIKQLAAKAGIADTDQGLVQLLNTNAAISDEAAGRLNDFLNNALTFDEAKRHPALKTFYYAQALNTVDATVDGLMNEMDLDADTRAEIKNADGSFKRIAELARKVRSLTEKKATASETQVEKLNLQIQEAKQQYDVQVAQLKSEAETSMTEFAIDAVLKAQQYANAMPYDVNALTTRALLEKEMAEKKIKVVRHKGELKLYSAEQPDTLYTEQNKPITFDDFAKRTLAAHKMLKVSEPVKAPVKISKESLGHNQVALGNLLSANEAQIKSLQVNEGPSLNN